MFRPRECYRKPRERWRVKRIENRFFVSFRARPLVCETGRGNCLSKSPEKVYKCVFYKNFFFIEILTYKCTPVVRFSLTVQHVHVDGLWLRVWRIALISAVVLDASLLYEQMAGGDRSFFGDYVHTSSGRIVTDYLWGKHRENSNTSTTRVTGVSNRLLACLYRKYRMNSFPKK